MTVAELIELLLELEQDRNIEAGCRYEAYTTRPQIYRSDDDDWFYVIEGA